MNNFNRLCFYHNIDGDLRGWPFPSEEHQPEIACQCCRSHFSKEEVAAWEAREIASRKRTITIEGSTLETVQQGSTNTIYTHHHRVWLVDGPWPSDEALLKHFDRGYPFGGFVRHDGDFKTVGVHGCD